MSNPTLEWFEAAFRAGNEAYNRGDFATAFAGYAPDCEYRPWDGFLTGRVEDSEELVLVGPKQIGRYFEEIFETFPDFHNEPVAFRQAGEGVFIVLNRARGTGRASRVSTDIAHGGIWELREGIVVRVREFSTWEEALNAAGLDPSTADEIREAERLPTS